ncbi:MAG: hypothetical protein IJW18_01435 [Lachnospiraceae bacterium]|nr:hypothetical protein [Lachnospiraceae bacterium]
MKKNEKLHINSYGIKDEDFLTAASSHDCTGLIPSAPQNEDEAENYEELYPYLPPVPTNKRK